MAFALGAARIGHGPQDVLEAGPLGGVESTAGSRAGREGRGVAGGQFGRAKFFLGVWRQGFEPEPVGVVVAGDEVAAVAREANGLAHGHPTGGLPTGAGVGCGVGGHAHGQRAAVGRQGGD